MAEVPVAAPATALPPVMVATAVLPLSHAAAGSIGKAGGGSHARRLRAPPMADMAFTVTGFVAVQPAPSE